VLTSARSTLIYFAGERRIPTSAKTGEGMDEYLDFIAGKLISARKAAPVHQ
jgi:hypothetical protein